MTSIEKALSCGLKREDLATDLWRRSALLYKTAGALHKSAEAWLMAGDKSAAAELFFAAGDDPQAAELFFECGRLAEAVTSAGRYLENSSTKDFSHKIAARLILAAAGSKSGDRAITSSLLREVRAELVSLDNDASQFQLGRAWESLARFGCRAKRP
ncbi:MAG: hypothetical protein KAG92_03550, partial [Deltaproteobacteria bacterium]|nr:hypothetical protein [Deltaproteobacteria bacterium]